MGFDISVTIKQMYIFIMKFTGLKLRCFFSCTTLKQVYCLPLVFAVVSGMLFALPVPQVPHSLNCKDFLRRNSMNVDPRQEAGLLCDLFQGWFSLLFRQFHPSCIIWIMLCLIFVTLTLQVFSLQLHVQILFQICVKSYTFFNLHWILGENRTNHSSI